MTEGFTDDRLLGGRLVFRQPETGYRAAIDPILLAAFTEPARGGSLVELGCGSGAALLCLSYRRPDLRGIGLERDPVAADLCRRNAAENAFDDRIDVITADLRSLPEGIARNAHDAVMMNPPYLDPSRHPAPPDRARAGAHSETDTELTAWIAAAHRLLRQGGQLTLIHRADRLDEIIAALMPRFGSFGIVPLWPRAGQAARRILIGARKGGKAPLELGAGLVLHRDDGTYTEAARRILEDGMALDAAMHETRG